MKSGGGYIIEESGDELNDETFGDLDSSSIAVADFDFAGRTLGMPSPPSMAPSPASSGRRGMTAAELEGRLLASRLQPIPIPGPPRRAKVLSVEELEGSLRSASLSMSSSPLTMGRPMSPPPGFVAAPRMTQSQPSFKPAPVISFPSPDEDGEEDPNRFLMSKYEREGIRHIHMAQLTTENPLLEDFYYQAFSKRSLKHHQNQSGTTLYLPLPNLKKKPASKDRVQNLEGALGKIVGSSSRKPRQQLQVDISVPHQSMKLGQEDISSEELYRSVLGTAERVCQAIFGLEDVLSQGDDTEYDAQAVEQTKAATKATVIEALAFEEGRDWGRADVLRFIHLLALPKGRKAIFRALRLLDTSFSRAFLDHLLENLEYLNVFRPNIAATEVDSFVNLLLSPLVPFVSDAPSRYIVNTIKAFFAKPSFLWLFFSRPGVILLCILMSRIEICKSAQGGDVESDPILGVEWPEFARQLFDLLSDRLMDLFNVPSLRSPAAAGLKNAFDGGDYYVWQFLALLALNVDAEAKKTMIVELREKIMAVVQHGSQKDLSHLNIFLNVLGLDASQLAGN